MKKTILVIFLSALCLIETTKAGSQEKWVTELEAKLKSAGSVLLYYDNFRYEQAEYYIPATLEQVSAAPAWNTNSPLPPMSLEKALTIALEELKQKNPDYDHFRLGLLGSALKIRITMFPVSIGVSP